MIFKYSMIRLVCLRSESAHCSVKFPMTLKMCYKNFLVEQRPRIIKREVHSEGESLGMGGEKRLGRKGPPPFTLLPITATWPNTVFGALAQVRGW